MISQLPKIITRTLIILFAGGLSVMVLIWIVPDIIAWKQKENQQQKSKKGTSEKEIKSEVFLMKFK